MGGVSFSAPAGVSVQVPQAADLKTQIAALSAQLGMGYLNELAGRNDVNWQQVKLAHESWDHTKEGLTPAGAALLSVAVAWPSDFVRHMTQSAPDGCCGGRPVQVRQAREADLQPQQRHGPRDHKHDEPRG